MNTIFNEDNMKELFLLLYKLEKHFDERDKDASSAIVGVCIQELNRIGVIEKAS
jgi:hypothetical protein